QHERLRELFDEEGIAPVDLDGSDFPDNGVVLLPESLLEGWSFPSADLSILSDHELFGRPRGRPAPRPRRHAREVFFTQFSPGDYVVHLEHGIGRFDSVTRMNVDGAEREYAVIQYAGTDRV